MKNHLINIEIYALSYHAAVEAARGLEARAKEAREGSAGSAYEREITALASLEAARSFWTVADTAYAEMMKARDNMRASHIAGDHSDDDAE